MKKNKNRLVILLILLLVFCSIMFFACEKDYNEEIVIDTSGSFSLSHFDGMDTEDYDTSLLWRNQTYVLNDGGGDSGVLWVDPEDDPINGGYFYMYTSGSSVETEDGQSPSSQTGPKAYEAWVHCYRSKDLLDWEACGAVNNTYCMAVYDDSWIESYLFAPECTYAYNEYLGKIQYYLYFSARSKTNNNELKALGAKYSSVTTENYYDRFYLSCAIADSPCGPFYLASCENYYGSSTTLNQNGKVVSDVNPVFLIDEECDELWMTDELISEGKDEGFSAIDISPFWDNGTLYIYFCRHFGAGGPDGSTVWGVKMKDPISPDWSTLTMLLSNSYTTMYVGTDWVDSSENSSQYAKFVRCEYKGSSQCDANYPRHLSTSYTRYTRYEDGTESDDQQREMALIEAPSMLKSKDAKGNDIYCLMYAPIGVSDFNYNVKLSVGYSPLGPFVKVNESDGATVLGVDAEVNDFMSNLGHVQFLTVDDEIWIAHYQQQAPFGGVDQGRPYALSSCSLQFNKNLQMYLPVANGPTTSLQALPSVATGYKNVAKDAKVTATNTLDNSLKYLTDGMWVTRSTNADKEFKAKQSTTITLTFDTPVYTRGLLIYNSYTYANAFKNISQIIFDLDETPSWHNGNELSCYINNLKYNEDDYRLQLNNGDIFQTGSAALATFNEIKVKKITIVINNSDMVNPGDELRVSDIVVLGKYTASENQEGLSDVFEYEYNRPYAGEPDEFMTIDGILDEEIWSECVFSDNYIDDVRVRTSTCFTTKGVYIALQAYSKNIEYDKRFTDRSAFHVVVTKTGTVTYNDNAYETFGNDHAYRFDSDAYYTRSHSRIPYYYSAVVDGVINSGNTTSITAELFLTWKDLYYTDEELTNGGAPESIQIYSSFTGVETLGTCSWRLETFPHYGAYGYLDDVSANGVGSIENGPQATDQWEINEDGNLYTRAGRTQISWIQDSDSSDFVIEATLKAEKDCTFRGANIYGNMGIIFMTKSGKYTIYMVDAKEVENNGSVCIRTAREIDTFHWINQIGYYETVESNCITNNTISLKMIKRGDKFYYLYNGKYFEAETLGDEYESSGWIGFYTSSGIEILNYNYTDYSSNVDELDDIISHFVYKIETAQKNSRGIVYADNASIKQGEAITIHIRASAGYMLTGLSLNGDESFYNVVINNMDENSDYSFIPNCDVSIVPKFEAIPKSGLVDCIIAFRDEDNNSLIGAEYVLKTDNPLIYFDQDSTSVNAKGNIVIKLLKEGSYTIGSNTINFSGKYNLTVKVSEFRDKTIEFTLNDSTTSTSLEGNAQSVSENNKFTLIVKPTENKYGTLKVNGTTPGWYGNLDYDDETEIYSIDHNGAFVYFKDKVADNQMMTTTIKFSQLLNNAGTDPISGVAFTSGSYSIVFKINREHSTDRLIIATGSSTVTYSEYALSGIPSSIGSTGGEFTFTVVRYNNVIYFVDCNNLLKFTISSSGLQFYNGCSEGWGWSDTVIASMNSYYKSFFKQGDQSALGVVSYNAGGNVSWDMDYTENSDDIANYINLVKNYVNLYREVSWINTENASTYKSWQATIDNKYTATNPGNGGCYTSYMPTNIEESDDFTITVKIKCSDISKVGCGIACFNKGGSCVCGVNVRYINNNLVLENMRYVNPYNGCDWPYVNIGENSVVADGEFYFRIIQKDSKTQVFIGDSIDSMEIIASLDDDWIRPTYSSYIPGLFVRGVSDDGNNVTVEFSEVTLVDN